MIEFRRGNLFDSSAEALVNTVNCVGVMGKGIAHQFKRAYPEMFKAYRQRCSAKDMRLGEVWAHRERGRVIVCFPTKGHWRSKSRIEDIEAGLASLREFILAEGIASVALPPLGCGNGGLEWAAVRELIVRELESLSEVRVEVYEPRTRFTSEVAKAPKLSLSHFVLLALRLRLSHGKKLALQKSAYFFNAYARERYFRFKQHKFGPYFVGMDPMLQAIKDYLDYHSMGTEDLLASGSERLLAGKDADRLERWQPAIERAAELCNRLGGDVEAVATAHAVLQDESEADLPTLTAAFLAWSKEKSERYEAADVERALDTLVDEGLADRTLLGYRTLAPAAPLPEAR